ncbi:hypothetical protein E1263_34665 [Kribbella antibiotica]|uniref:Uncharacterized protein n=1 Tax=Kribbella antibiotica TaxID=190195 RepID=A0A4R4YQC3_9ACTN|nr:hypothetical protein [Kribbella antibiotica]TDD47346.1 hypothetical protein E1263_34665 [Kribbella antibiotica]
MFSLKPWLWIANASATLLLAVAIIAQLVDAGSPDDSSCGPQCDPHGYTVIFIGLPSVLGALFTLNAVGFLVARRRAGLWLAVIAAAGCAFELLLLRSLLSTVRIVEVGLVIVVTVVLAILGLRTPPVPARPPYRLPEPPYPPA